MIEKHHEDFLKANIGKEEPFIPKPNLTFREYNAINNFFSQADFERNSFVAMSLPLTIGVLWFA